MKKIQKIKPLIPIILIIIGAFIVRYIFVKYNFSFSSETAGDLIDFRNSYLEGHIPLLGPHSGTHPWLYFSPLYYWIFFPVVRIFGFGPLVFAYTGLVISVFTILVNYLVTKKILSMRFAIISSLVICFSPLWISFAKDARFYTLSTLVFYPFLVNLKALWDNRLKSVWWISFWLGLAITFHYSALTFIPVVLIIFFIKRKNLSKKVVGQYLLGSIIPFTPFIISGSGLKILSDLALWVPYRLGGFFGAIPKNNLTVLSFTKSIEGISDFIGKMILFSPKLNYVFLGALAIGAFIFIVKYRSKLLENFWFVFIFVSIFFSFLAVIIHGGFIPVHYFVFLAPVIVFLLSFFFEWVLRTRKKLPILCLTFFIVATFYSNFHYTQKIILDYKKELVIISPHFVPLPLLEKVSKSIVEKANGEKFSLRRVGPFDYYNYDYAQNYSYLMWLNGNEPQDGKSLTFTVYEDKNLIPSYASGVYFVGNIGILEEK